MDMYFLEIASYWGMAIVGAVATLYTVLKSREREERHSAIFNLLSFLVGTTFLHLVIRNFFPGYSFWYKLRDSWLPFRGLNIFLYFIFADYLFYIYHRLVHRVPILWLGHYAHHSGVRLHLSLIIRDSILGHIFVLPIALLGVPLGLSPYGLFIWIRIITFYQAFLHFPVTKDIPVLKYIFITPYNHIIHHSTCFKDAGHNFGGILSFWDRLSGTYREGEQYLKGFGIPGLERPDSLWGINTLPMIELVKKCWHEKSLWPLFSFKEVPPLYQSGWVSVALYSLSLVLLIDTLYRGFGRMSS